MPPDINKTTKRREKKPTTPEEIKEIEQKRLKGELSCAECRRLKLRCDKKVPCSSCVRRGCESICPCGILEAGVGTRFILASTNQLHSKISAMSARIRSLEDGLAIMQAAVSAEKHPLLDEELLKIKFGAETLNEGKILRQSSQLEYFEEDEGRMRERTPSTSSLTREPTSFAESSIRKASQADMSALDTLGTLTLGEEGELKYFGRSAGSEALIIAGEEYVSDDESEPFSPSPQTHHSPQFTDPFPSSLPAEIYALAMGSSASPKPELNSSFQSHLFQLPPAEHAHKLARSYLEHAAHFFRPVTKWELLGEPNSDGGILGRTYIYRDSLQQSPYTAPSPHLLSTLFFVFALGAFFDLTQTTHELHEAEKWFRLGRSALLLSSDPSAPDSSKEKSAPTAEETVCALGLMATYITMTGSKYSRDHAWCAMSLAVKVAQGAGLHRDPERWNMEPNAVQRRRRLWWEVYSADVSHSLALGRPPSVNLLFTDTEFPIDEEATLRTITTDDNSPASSTNGEESQDSVKQEIIDGFWRTKYRFSRDCFTSVINATLTTKTPSYETVMELDRKVRESPLPIKQRVTMEEDGEEVYRSSSLTLRDFFGGQYRTVTMLYLHRSFFAHAMLHSPSNPFLSPFAPSFLASYRAASMLVKAGVQMYDRCPQITGRVWFLMYHVFSAAVVLGTVVTRSPNSTVAPSALVDLNLAVDLFEKCSSASHRIKVSFIVLKKLQEKAIRSYNQFVEAASPTSTNGASPSTDASSPSVTGSSPKETETLNPNLFSDKSGQGDEHDVEGELEMFGGQTKVLRAKPKTRKYRAPSNAGERSPASEKIPTGATGALITNPLGDDPDMTMGAGNGTVTPIPGNSNPSVPSFGFGAGTTGTVIGGLNIASMSGLGSFGMDVDNDMGFDFGMLPSPSDDISNPALSVVDTSSTSEPSAEEKTYDPQGYVNPLVQYLSGSSMSLPGESLASWSTSKPAQSSTWQQSPPTNSPLSSGLNQWGDMMAQPGPSMYGAANNVSQPADNRRYDDLYNGFMEYLAHRVRSQGMFSPGGGDLNSSFNRNWGSQPPPPPATSALPPTIQQWYSQFGERQAATAIHANQITQAHSALDDQGTPTFRHDYDLLLQSLGLPNQYDNNATRPGRNWNGPVA